MTKTFQLPEKGHLTSYGVGLFGTDSHFGFEVDTPGMLLGDGKRYYIHLAPVPKNTPLKIAADAIGVFTLFTDEDTLLARGSVLDADVNYTIFPEDEMPSSLFLETEDGKRVFIEWDRKGYKVSELD